MKARAQLHLTFEDATTADAVASSVSGTNLRIGLSHELREDVLPFAVEWDGVLVDDNPQPRQRERLRQTTGARGLQSEQPIRGAKRDHVFAIREDVSDLPRVPRYNVRDCSGKQRVRGTSTELEVSRGPDSQRVPIDRSAPRSPGSQVVEGRLALPQDSERKTRARRPLAEEDLGRFEGFQVERLRDNRLTHRPDLIELEGHRAPHRLDHEVDVRHAGDLVDHRSQALAKRPAALGENEEAFRGRCAVSLLKPPPEPMEDRAMRGLGADVGERSGAGNLYALFQEFVMAAELAHGGPQRGMGARPPLRQATQGALGDRLTDLPDRTEARVQVVFGEEGPLRRPPFHTMRGGGGATASALP